MKRKLEKRGFPNKATQFNLEIECVMNARRITYVFDDTVGVSYPISPFPTNKWLHNYLQLFFPMLKTKITLCYYFYFPMGNHIESKYSNMLDKLNGSTYPNPRLPIQITITWHCQLSIIEENTISTCYVYNENTLSNNLQFTIPHSNIIGLLPKKLK